MQSAATPLNPAQPLQGLRVIEFSHMVMGPTCGMILADLGAEVIKVEPPGGDKTRNLLGIGIGFFRAFNRNKKSVEIDIANAKGQAQAKKLIATADIVIENFRPGLMQEFGLDYSTLKTEYPNLIYASHKGFLPGPYEHRLALDEVVQMMGGLAYMTGPVGQPLRAGASVNDIMGGMFGVIGILAALRAREATGVGQEVQSALYENCVFLSSQHMQQYLMTQEPPPPMPARVSSWSVYDVFEVAGGEQLFIGAVSDRQFALLCEVLDRPDLANNPLLATNSQRVLARAAMLPEIAKSVKPFQKNELAQKLEAAGLPYAPIMRPDELCHDPHMLQSGGIVAMGLGEGGQTDVVLLPLTMDGQRMGVRMPLPVSGQHNAEYLD